MTKIIQDANLGINLRKYRLEKRISQIDLCARMDVLGRPMLPSTYNQIEHGKRNILLSDLIALKIILDVSFDDLLGGLNYVVKNLNVSE